MRYIVLIALTMIASRFTSYGQSTDSVVCFTTEETRAIAKKIAECTSIKLELNNYQNWNRDLQIKSDILQKEVTDLTNQKKELITKLNDETIKRKKSRKSRIWWGVTGFLAGAITYSLII